jgi:formylmethanofuran dehydrogenase subunit C
MSGLKLIWKGGNGGPPLDASPLLPETLGELSSAEIARVRLRHGNRQVHLGDLFDVATGTAEGSLLIQGATDRFDHLGKGMNGGTLRIEGDAGDFLGQDLAAGTIELAGNAGRYAASGMAAGVIRIGGDAGDFLAASLPGGRFGMQGGAVMVGGRLGARAGDRMRRGLVIVAGEAGAYLGARMIGGTFVVGGRCGRHPGLAMRRGTLVLAAAPDDLLPTFIDGGPHDLSWLRLLADDLRLLGWPKPDLPIRRRRFTGCTSSAGKGEILTLS